MDLFCDKEPVQVLKGTGDKFSRVVVSEVTACRIWEVLGFIEKLIVPYAVAVVKAGRS